MGEQFVPRGAVEFQGSPSFDIGALITR
jgi:hypothetical protein